MNFQFTNPLWLLALPPALAWAFWFAWKSDAAATGWRKWSAFLIRSLILSAVICALAGLQWRKPKEGMNVMFLLDRSDSVPSAQQELARDWTVKMAAAKKPGDKAGVLVFGSEASIEARADEKLDLQKILAVVPTERTDIASAIRLGVAALPEAGQKRLVLLTDGNENLGDAMAALAPALPLGVSVYAVPMGAARGNDVSIQKVSLPPALKRGQTFETRIHVQSDAAKPATLRIYRNNQYLGEQPVQLAEGKNLFTFPQTLDETGFYSYDVRVEAAGDTVVQNNRGSGFAHVRGDPRVLLISAQPDQDATLVAALRTSKLDVRVVDVTGFPPSLAELQSYDAVLLSNIAAGDLGSDLLKLLEAAVRDFGVGLVCIGGDNSYLAGGYRGTPLEEMLPVKMELDSKKVLPRGALVLVVHATEFPGGNQWARDIALAALDALGADDEMGIVLWDGKDKWLFDLSKVGDKKEKGKTITGMNPGDMPSFQNVMTMAHDALKKSTANLKHMVVFSDGDPTAPSQAQLQGIIGDRITISSVMIGGHVEPSTMVMMADIGKGRFYDVSSPSQLPQIFVKEAAVILKTAIIEEPFKPRLSSTTELVRGIGADEYPQLFGYVASQAKDRGEIALTTHKGDPLLAHWQYGLGRAVAFTSDAKAKWAQPWLGWDRYRQFWTQIVQWSLRRVESADLQAEVTQENGEGVLNVEAVDSTGNYRNFLALEAVVISPKGEKQTVRLQQNGAGRYEVKFPMREVGAYFVNVMEFEGGQLRGAQPVGASVNHSPEFDANGANLPLLQRLTELGGGRMLDPRVPTDNPFLLARRPTFQPVDVWEWLLKFAVVMFVLDVGVRRIDVGREEFAKMWAAVRRAAFFWKPKQPVKQEESLAALLARRDRVREQTQAAQPQVEVRPELFEPVKTSTLDEVEPKQTEETKPGEVKPDVKGAGDVTTTSRLLEAKKRAQKK
ncbi:MAG: VWA domain-containing protein [Verrucomicrobia bacterium]|nr:VWA domain-containing protein [Verrucomicrobiota bacterium]